MRELMLKLLTYEPFEKISGDTVPTKAEVDELYEKYPTLIVNSEYITMHDNVNFTCSVCHNNFDRAAADIFYRLKNYYYSS